MAIKKLKKGERVAKISVATNVALSAAKFSVAWVSGSVAMMADALNAFSDIFSSLAVVLGLKLAQKNPTEKFPYGYYRAETIASLIVSAFIVLTGIEILKDGIERIFNPVEIRMIFPVISMAIISAVVLFWLARLKTRTGKEINSIALINEGKHSFADVLASVVVAFGVFSSSVGIPEAEGVVAIVISLFVVKTGLEQAWSSSMILMDSSVPKKLTARVKKIAFEVDGVREVKKVKIRRSGPFLLGEMELGVSSTLNLEKAHKISENVENRIAKKMPEVDHLSIHLEPSLKGNLRIALPTVKKGLNGRVSEKFGEADYFVFVDTIDGKIGKVSSEKNPAKGKRRQGIEAAKFLVDRKTEILIDGKLGRGPMNALKSAGVALYLRSGKKVSTNINKFFFGKLEELE